ncbi:uncharacterized protein LOC143198738 [Rhynchophorus ferrugineus]|uniref:uncharacterized protein LOC143198738 n=1 Tax=Rhynchophorus ferrugineus TaxID=354439 RepID=UPI003FCEC7B5
MEEYKKECITVSIRIKPSLCPNTATSLQVISKNPPIIAVVDRSQAYHFDHIFTDEASQEQIYNETVKPLVDYVKKGFSATVFAYGQTGTGKTYTMGTTPEVFVDDSYNGIIPRALEQVFIEDDCNNTKDILISFLEIYNEKVYDLLQPTRKLPLPVSGFMVQDMVLKHADDVNTALNLLELGNKNRHIAETKQNINSSRSHAIFTVHFTLKNSTEIVTGKLNLVDLAGLESVKKTGNIGSTFYEGVNINKGLLSIGQVISALSMKSAYIPYRQSMITSILQGSLNTENYISLIACVSSSVDDITETLQTLDFSQRAKKICSNPEVNQILTKYRREYTSQTPLKRLNATPLRTSNKRIALPPRPFGNKNGQNQRKQSISQALPDRIMESSITKSGNTVQEMLSPVIRKYVKEMEESIMEKMQIVIQNAVEKPRKNVAIGHNLMEDIENTPAMAWDKIQNKVLKLVRSEISQLTVQATSSPIEYNEAAKIKRVLNYNSPENISLLSEENELNDHSFKVPEPPLPKKKYQRKSVLSRNGNIKTNSVNIRRESWKDNCMVEEFPDNSTWNCNISNRADNKFIENEAKIPRRSMRLAKNKMDNTFGDDFESSLNKNNMSSINVNNTRCTRRSARISFKQSYFDKSIQPEKTMTDKSVKNRSKLRVKKSKTSKTNKTNELENVKFPITPSHATNAYTNHLNNVLNILNNGNLKQLESLQSIGPKTAEQILIYRQLRGNFKEIADISKIPGWGEKKFERFMVGNMLIINK